MTGNTPDVLVVGAGVSGLTTAVCLAEAGLAVTIVTKHPPRETTSAVAGAVWGPHLVESSERVERWGRETLLVLRDLAGEPGSGVRMGTGITAARSPHDSGEPPESLAPPGARVPAGGPGEPGGLAAPGGVAGGTATPPGAAAFGDVRRCAAPELPAGFADGWRYTVPLVHMPVYLDYLLARLERAGGRVRPGAVISLTAAAREAGAPVVVNCTGTGARDLVGDPAVTPVRGQIAVVANPGISEFFIGLPGTSADLVYVFPHGDTLVLGGTEVAGQESLEPDPATAERILRDCAAIEPRLRDAPVLAHRVGLRPLRPRVRLEAVHGGGQEPDGPARPPGQPLLVHNYGHGGAGVTLSWGCAREAAALIGENL